MRLRPVEYLENCRPKCKMHTQERQLTRFCILQLICKENRSDGFSEPKPNGTHSFSQNQTELNLKNPFRTSLMG